MSNVSYILLPGLLPPPSPLHAATCHGLPRSVGTLELGVGRSTRSSCSNRTLSSLPSSLNSLLATPRHALPRAAGGRQNCASPVKGTHDIDVKSTYSKTLYLFCHALMPRRSLLPLATSIVSSPAPRDPLNFANAAKMSKNVPYID